MKTRRWLVIAIVVTSLLVVLAAIPVLWLAWRFIGMGLIMSENDKQAQAFVGELQKPAVFTPAALTLARMCLAGYTNGYHHFTNIVPRSTNGFGDCWGGVSSNRASMEFGGGPWHFGYDLTLDETNSRKGTNYWILTMYSEGEPTRTLLEFPLSASETDNPALPKAVKN